VLSAVKLVAFRVLCFSSSVCLKLEERKKERRKGASCAPNLYLLLTYTYT